MRMTALRDKADIRNRCIRGSKGENLLCQKQQQQFGRMTSSVSIEEFIHRVGIYLLRLQGAGVVSMISFGSAMHSAFAWLGEWTLRRII